MSDAAGDLSRRALEALALEEYRSERISKARLLGIETRYELDGFLKDRQVWANHTTEDLRRDLEDLDSLGLRGLKLATADTGPANYLILIDHIALLPALFERVALPLQSGTN